ncbi:TPA: hypothetical protein ACH3X1_004373 [Trebouxia sp. C0004]
MGRGLPGLAKEDVCKQGYQQKRELLLRAEREGYAEKQPLSTVRSVDNTAGHSPLEGSPCPTTSPSSPGNYPPLQATALLKARQEASLPHLQAAAVLKAHQAPSLHQARQETNLPISKWHFSRITLLWQACQDLT